MTEREKQILDIIIKLRNSTPISELEKCAKNCNMSLDDYIDHEEASEIASLFEGYYEKEFVEWKDDPDNTGYFDGVYYIFELSEERGHTLKQVYEYWQKEVNK